VFFPLPKKIIEDQKKLVAGVSVLGEIFPAEDWSPLGGGEWNLILFSTV
jgi:hypothetical protein